MRRLHTSRAPNGWPSSHLPAHSRRTRFPEWRCYVRRNRLSAGAYTHAESGYLVEIAQEAALRAGKHIWVDGSLRDAEWYQLTFRRILAAHPRYRIAILHVLADEATVFERVRRRALETGRGVPDHEVCLITRCA